jgi:tetratricopeptide (TPR) repeat protein
MSSVDALRKHYARDPEFLDAIITSYTAPQYSMLLSASAPASVDVTPTPISRADVLYELARLLGSLDRGVADADRLFRAALDDNPRHALSLAGLGRLRSREMKDAEALALFERALESDPNDAIVNLMFAEALLRPEIGGLAETTQRTADDLPRFRRARELAEKALALHADETRALGAIGTSYIVEAGFTPGIAPLEKAHALFPNRSDFGLHLLALYVRNGDLSKAGALVEELKRVLPPPLQEVMTTILLRPDIDRVNKLVAGEKLDEAVAELRKLSASTTDANAKQQLDRQAAIIERDARRNREVNAFNDALKFSGDGNRDAAVKLLDQLLISASDATVLQSARQLRSALGARP